MDFDYQSHFLHRLTQLHDVARPVQIELHPGLHCDLFRCPHCYGHKQRPIAGKVIGVEDIARALDDVARYNPTIVVSGVTTDPLTHPDAPGIIRAVRSRNLALGLYTKGNRFDGSIIDEMLEGDSECFVTFSIDAVDNESYITTHDIARDQVDKYCKVRGADYFDHIVENVTKLRAARDGADSSLQIRVALLLFDTSANEETVELAVRKFTPIADLIRFAFPQNRNDGEAPGKLPDNRDDILRRLAAKYNDNHQVKILQATAQPTRRQSFHRCHVQRFQAVIDKTGNVFPCPQVAVSNYTNLSFGNIIEQRFADLLQSAKRRSMFDLEVDRDMKCRICDRKDEAVNLALDRFERRYTSSQMAN